MLHWGLVLSIIYPLKLRTSTTLCLVFYTFLRKNLNHSMLALALNNCLLRREREKYTKQHVHLSIYKNDFWLNYCRCYTPSTVGYIVYSIDVGHIYAWVISDAYLWQNEHLQRCCLDLVLIEVSCFWCAVIIKKLNKRPPHVLCSDKCCVVIWLLCCLLNNNCLLYYMQFS